MKNCQRDVVLLALKMKEGAMRQEIQAVTRNWKRSEKRFSLRVTKRI